MHPTSNGPRYLMRWDYSNDQRLGRDRVTTTHRLAELTLFSDEGLAEILDRYPREALRVSTMGHDPAYPSQLREGRLGDHSGIKLIEIIRRGRLCLRIQDVVQHHRELGRIVSRLCSEMIECQPGLRTGAYEADLEISSPAALTYFGHDATPNIFWQIRGSRNIWSYPDRDPLVSTKQIEQSILRGSRNRLYFEPAFDDHSEQRQQASGDVLALPQYTPYRAVNGSHLSVTLTTSYETRESRRRNQIHLANRTLRRFTPVSSVDTQGFRFVAKRMISSVIGHRQNNASRHVKPTFCVDAESECCVRPLDLPADESATTVPAFPGLGFETTTPTAVAEH